MKPTLWRFAFDFLGPYWHPDGNGSGGAAAAGSADASGAAGDAGAAAGSGGAAGAAAAGAASADKVYTFKEDRANWVDPEKFKKSETLVNRTARELENARGVIAEQNRRIAALAGVTPPNPDDAEAQKIADAFFALPQFAHLRGITPELIQQMQALISDGASLTEASNHVWNQHTDRYLARLDEHFASELGVDTLSAGQQRKLHAAFGALIPDERAEPEAYASFRKRYEAGDETLITDFVKEYVTDMLEPARRQATVMPPRRPVPRSGATAPVVTQTRKPDYAQMKTVGEMLEAAEKEAEAVGR